MARQRRDISQQQWHLWLDQEAKWQNDKLYTPNESKDISKLPMNPPTVGWSKLEEQDGKTITLPATVEEFYSKGVNDWEYHGVSWYFTDLIIPTEAEGKRIALHFEKTRLRAEIYVNERLMGYDLVSETPFDVDITKVVKYGQVNKMAVRITNAGGTRGWNDVFAFNWGECTMLPSHDFSIVGHVSLVMTDKTYIENVFVKNILPACGNKLEIITEVNSHVEGEAKVEIEISKVESKAYVFKDSFKTLLSKGANTFNKQIVVPEAKLWDIHSPNLYNCKVTISEGEQTDDICERFGFRVMEVKEATTGNLQYFLNGERIRHKSAIDWGYYAHTGAYATEEMAEKSVRNAKAIGHTAINFHRQIGEPLIMEKADELGLYMYEEPGGIKTGDLFLTPKGLPAFGIENHPLLMELFEVRLERMIKRDRNHPSLLIYTMANEDKKFTDYRAKVLQLANELDDSRFIINSSGSNAWPSFLNLLGSFMKHSITCAPERRVVKHFSHYNYKPYSSQLEKDHVDCHTVNASDRFEEEIFESHQVKKTRPTRYWGEVGCYCGPANWYDVCEDQKNLPDGREGYDNNIYQGMHDKLEANYDKWHLEGTCDGTIQSKSDVSKQAGRGLMYIDGRFSQTMCSYDATDGYAINGWSSGPQVGSQLEGQERAGMDWDSALCDEGRNLKGPAEDYAYWTRPLQIALFRSNGAYFKPNGKVDLRCVLINEGALTAGDYKMSITVRDRKGYKYTNKKDMVVHVKGGDTFAQELDKIKLTLDSKLAGGHVSFDAVLIDNEGDIVAEGKEQVLLDNPQSFGDQLKELKGCTYKWDAATKALKAANATYEDFNPHASYDFIAAAEVPDKNELTTMLHKVKEGSTMVINFNEGWAKLLLDVDILSEAVTEWGCEQTGFWYGNGWGYVSEFIGDAFPSGNVISTNGWQPTGDPNGFYPFESKYDKRVYGLWMARHDIMRVTMASIDYGKGKILLNPSYELADKDILSKIIFYNMISFNLGGI
ncbi:glycoside hydrolase family 2 protein [Vallitalea okinawensis]|uniref:glycoside hydrolase family 2 protein n=1 Tax=Vallitalea okinawensis TaxID=2078660 RepID=UPI000CFAFBAC|nr:sugar-binding domain-containing protein [Vallitalea okinawensis]